MATRTLLPLLQIWRLPTEIGQCLKRVHLDGFVLSLALVVLAATVLPCRGTGASLCHAAGMLAISALFFLQGARLSRQAVLNGIMHWKLHLVIAGTTFVFFPLLGLGLAGVFPSLLPPVLWLGVLFVCALPSTVQSSVALTSIAQGNVAGAVCSATMSNVSGIVITPVLFGLISRVHGGSFDIRGLGEITLQLLVPFIIGHLARPWLGAWAERNRPLLSITDRASILLVAYTAFSGAVVHGIWRQVPLHTFLALSLLMTLLLAAALLIMLTATRLLGFAHNDEVAAVFCGSQKSLVSGVPMANVLFASASVGPVLLPIMIYYPVQLLLCAWLARRYARSVEARRLAVPAAVVEPLIEPSR